MPTQSLSADMGILLAEVRAAGFPDPEREHYFARGIGRLWRFDLAWPAFLVAFEREGFGRGFGKAGRHQRAEGYSADVGKYNFAAISGWVVIRATPITLRDGTAARDLIAALRVRSRDRQQQGD